MPLKGIDRVIGTVEQCPRTRGRPDKAAADKPKPPADIGVEWLASSGDRIRPAGRAPRTGGPCPDDGPRLPVTGLCRGQARAYLGPPPGPDLFIFFPDRACSWDLQEAALPDDSALLFRVLRCKGVTSHLDLAGGAYYTKGP